MKESQSSCFLLGKKIRTIDSNYYRALLDRILYFRPRTQLRIYSAFIHDDSGKFMIESCRLKFGNHYFCGILNVDEIWI